MNTKQIKINKEQQRKILNALKTNNFNSFNILMNNLVSKAIKKDK